MALAVSPKDPRLSRMTFAGRVVVFSITGCPYCKRAKALLRSNNIPFHDVNLEKYPNRRHEMQERTGRTSVPQIFFNSRHIGGWDNLKELYDTDGLAEVLKEVEMNEPLPDAPQPPPDDDSHDGESQDDNILLPSQRDAVSGECTPDELASLAQEIQESGLVKTHTYHLIAYKNSFVGRELVSWLVEQKGTTKEEAIKLGRDLVRRHFIHHVTYAHDFEDDYLFYRFLGDIKTRALNAGLSHHCLPRSAIDIAEDLRKFILEIYADHLSPDGYAVNYQGISMSPKFEQYIRATSELKRVDLSKLDRKGKLAFFINIYNALVIHAFVVHGPPTNTLRRLMFFNQVSYIIGGQEFSLNDIESGILRGNRKPVAALRRPFSRNDIRLTYALEQCEPKIHFALVCGAKSCPPIKTYSAENVDEELTLACQSFIEGPNVIIDQDRREISISTIFKWYKVDFGANNQELLEWIYAQYLDSFPKKQQLRQLLDSRSYHLKYLTYNWDLNSS